VFTAQQRIKTVIGSTPRKPLHDAFPIKSVIAVEARCPGHVLEGAARASPMSGHT
jgi:hypothetical protein